MYSVCRKLEQQLGISDTFISITKTEQFTDMLSIACLKSVRVVGRWFGYCSNGEDGR